MEATNTIEGTQPLIQFFKTRLSQSMMALCEYHDTVPQGGQTAANANALAIVSADTTLSTLRTELAPMLLENPQAALPQLIDIDHVPLLLSAYPLMAEQLGRGQHWGTELCVPSLHVSDSQRAAWFAHKLLNATPLLTSADALSDADRQKAERTLAALRATFSVDANHPLHKQFAILFDAVQELLPGLPDSGRPLDDAPAAITDLRAVYEEIDTALLVLPVWASLSLRKIDWAAVQEHFGAKFERLMVTTDALLPKLATHDLSVAFAIGRYRHQWGQTFLKDHTPDVPDLLRNAAQTVLHIYTIELPQAFFAADDDELGMLIHDIQNQLLKVQFQYELLTMMYPIPRRPAPRLHVDRTLPASARVELLHVHLRDWLALYSSLLL